MQAPHLLSTRARRSRGVPWATVTDIGVPAEHASPFLEDTGELEWDRENTRWCLPPSAPIRRACRSRSGSQVEAPRQADRRLTERLSVLIAEQCPGLEPAQSRVCPQSRWARGVPRVGGSRSVQGSARGRSGTQQTGRRRWCSPSEGFGEDYGSLPHRLQAIIIV